MKKTQLKNSLLFEEIKCLPIFIIGRIASFHYDKKYLKGKWFSGKFGGLRATGWRWAYYDLRGCKKLHVNLDCPWPVNPRTTVLYPENIVFDPDDLNNFQSPGTYYQANGKIIIGKGTFIGPNVGLITSNHTIGDLEKHDLPLPIKIGEKCWIGMNSVVLPGITLGNNTIVGAGSVVTKSFPDGNCVIAGSPAKIIKQL